MATATHTTDTRNTRQRLVDTARELMWKNSYGSVSVDDICKQAEAKKGSFYHYFPSKVDLALASMEEDSRLWLAQLNEIFSASTPPLRRFEHYADVIYRSQQDIAAQYGHVCGCPCTSLASEMAGQTDVVRQKFDEITVIKKRFYESAVRDLIAEGSVPATLDAKAKAHEIYTFIIGQLMMARIENSLNPLAAELHNGLRRILGVST